MNNDMNICDSIKETFAENTFSVTENGAIGFKYLENPFVDFFFRVSSMRRWKADKKYAAFLKCASQDEELAYRLLFFVRDVRGGLGERQLFRDIYKLLPEEKKVALFQLIPEYGRWDDLVCLLNDTESISDATKDTIYKIVKEQLAQDVADADKGASTSLLAKWLPSIAGVSNKQVWLAKRIAKSLGFTDREYRKTLSKLRSYIKVTERQMSDHKWSEIQYGEVPAKAHLNYKEAFKRHDAERYAAYLDSLKLGKGKINASTLFPYEIVHRYGVSNTFCTIGKTPVLDETLEQQWVSLLEKTSPGGVLKNTIVVRDGSGSMLSNLGGATNATALDVSTSMAIFLASFCEEPFKDKFITFSANPKFIDLSACKTLYDKLLLTTNNDDCTTTNIEKTMDLLLQVAIKNELTQEQIPNVLIISDMEFDAAMDSYRYWDGAPSAEQEEDVLFNRISKKWEQSGYSLPKMIFWNVCSRTEAIPMRTNDKGILLVSGFSQNIVDMLNGNDPFDAIKTKLMSQRYAPVSAKLSGEKIEMA